MILISHRGNINGADPYKENTPKQIEMCLLEGYNVEIDVRVVNGSIYLGHDGPECRVGVKWLESFMDKSWVHCKNLDSLCYFRESKFNYFWHGTDDYAITSHGHIWVYPGKEFNKRCIVVMPETWSKELKFECKGICSDNISMFGGR